jgi:hypothetical protein
LTCVNAAGGRLGFHETPCPNDSTRSTPMLDVMLLALIAGLFAISIGYAYACEWL